MTLTKYKSKRNLTVTPEPKAKKASSKGNPIFVVQKHAARRLHYDFRLEHNGVLLSWAIPKGPSMDPHEKRLAVHVEDHPLEYASFSGEIPAGHYGAGTVEIWDSGTYETSDANSKKEISQRIQAGLNKGHLEVILKGKRLNGIFDLIHLKNNEKENLWILVKRKDEYAKDDESVIEEKPKKVTRKRALKKNS